MNGSARRRLKNCIYILHRSKQSQAIRGGNGRLDKLTYAIAGVQPKFYMDFSGHGCTGAVLGGHLFPSFPAIAQHFGVTVLQVQSTLSFYLLALAGMSLFHGALSDCFGRRRVILWSLGLYTLTAMACPFAPSFGVLLFCRTLQGLAGGWGMIVGRAMIRDRFQGAEAQRFIAEVTIVSGLAPVIAPVVGGWLHVWFGWRGPFLLLALLGMVMLAACYWALPESLRKKGGNRSIPER